VLLGHGHVPGRDGRQGSSPAGIPGPAAWPQGRVIAGRSALQAATARGTPLAGSPSLSQVVRDQIRWACCWTMAKSPGVAVRRDHHLVGEPVRRPGSQGRVIADRNAQQCCNRSRCSVGRRRCRARVTGGALLGDGQVPGRGGAPRSSPGGRPDPAAWPPGAGERRQERAAVLQPLAVQCRPATLPSSGHRWGAAGRWPSPRARVIAGRSELQCCNRSRRSVGRRRCRAGVTGGALLGRVPGWDGRQEPSLGGGAGSESCGPARQRGSRGQGAILFAVLQ